MTNDRIYQPGIRGDAERTAAGAADAAARTAATAEWREQARRDRLAAAKHHRVTVTTRVENAGTADERRVVDRVAFECTAPADADCHTYPDCDCESWSWNDEETADQYGHERIPGRKCWLADWFEADGAIYQGEDADDMRDDQVPAVDRTGQISTYFQDEWIEWEFVNEGQTDGE